MEDGQSENFINNIIDERKVGRGRQYLVRRVGFSEEDDEWLLRREILKTGFGRRNVLKDSLGVNLCLRHDGRTRSADLYICPVFGLVLLILFICLSVHISTSYISSFPVVCKLSLIPVLYFIWQLRAQPPQYTRQYNQDDIYCISIENIVFF